MFLRAFLFRSDSRRTLTHNHSLGNGCRWVPSPDSYDEPLLRFLGVLMGAAARAGAFMELDLSAMVWKLLLGETVSRADLAGTDTSRRCCRCYSSRSAL
jgi:hypothetical protein